MPQAVTIESLPEAFEVIKEMQAEGYSWGEDYRPAGRAALARTLEDGMAVSLDRHLREMARRDEADRRNGTYSRHLLTELGDIELCVPRTRRFNPVSVVRAYARRAGHIDRLILAGFVLGLSTRKVASELLSKVGDAPILPRLSQQCGSPAASRAGLQSRQFHADVGLAEGGGALVADHATREAGQDRGQSCPPWPVRHVPIGRSRRALEPVSGNPAAGR